MSYCNTVRGSSPHGTGSSSKISRRLDLHTAWRLGGNWGGLGNASTNGG